jgi:hypothetical protein
MIPLAAVGCKRLLGVASLQRGKSEKTCSTSPVRTSCNSPRPFNKSPPFSQNTASGHSRIAFRNATRPPESKCSRATIGPSARASSVYAYSKATQCPRWDEYSSAMTCAPGRGKYVQSTRLDTTSRAQTAEQVSDTALVWRKGVPVAQSSHDSTCVGHLSDRSTRTVFHTSRSSDQICWREKRAGRYVARLSAPFAPQA